MPKTKVILNEKLICDEYLNTKVGVESIALKYHVGKLKIKDILKRNGIVTKKRGAQSNNESFIVSDYKIKKYQNTNTYHYIVIDPSNNMFSSKDIDNRGGTLTTYIENRYSIKTPSLYDRRMYYMRTGNYWWEQWLQYAKIENKPTKKCPYCDWETTDINNRSGVFEQHLKKKHNITKIDYLNEHSEDKLYFELVNEGNNRQMENNPNKFVVCKICGRKLSRVDSHHLQIHGINKEEYINRYGVEGLSSAEYHDKQSKASIQSNINTTFHKYSADEQEIMALISSNGYECHSNRKILNGKEIDIYIPSLKIGIEYNGNIWHSDQYGKDSNYHINKTKDCENKGVHLIQIFEDEYHLQKEIVMSKILHIIKKSNGPKIPARKCTIKKILKYEAEDFLNKNHIQGFSNATLYIGAYYKDNLVAVMTFVEESHLMWNLNRFASDIKYVCQGIGSKMFSFFKKNYSFKEVKSFADRRWMSPLTHNIYDVMGFKISEFLRPNYSYYNPKINRYKRYHKFGFRKKTLLKKFPNSGLTYDMTETEMTKKLGFTRIWDCGLIKYVYKNGNTN